MDVHQLHGSYVWFFSQLYFFGFLWSEVNTKIKLQFVQVAKNRLIFNMLNVYESLKRVVFAVLGEVGLLSFILAI